MKCGKKKKKTIDVFRKSVFDKYILSQKLFKGILLYLKISTDHNNFNKINIKYAFLLLFLQQGNYSIKKINHGKLTLFFS